MSNRAQKQQHPLEQSPTVDQTSTTMHATHRRARVGSAILAILILAGLTYAVAGIPRDSGSPTATRLTSAVPAPFGPHYDGLVQRRRAAHIPTMMTTMNSPVHFHPLLKVYVNGKRLTVPANIGIDPREDSMQMAGLHTHDTSGTIHVEGVPGPRLGQFFAIWGVPLSAGRLGPFRGDARKRVRMWVSGKASAAFGALKLADGQHIVVSFGARDAGVPTR